VTLTGPAGATAPAGVHFFPYQERPSRGVGQANRSFAIRTGHSCLTLPVANQLAPGFTRSRRDHRDQRLTSGGALVKTMTLETPLAERSSPVRNPRARQRRSSTSPRRVTLGRRDSLAVAMVFALIGASAQPHAVRVRCCRQGAFLTKPGHGNRHHLRIEGLCFRRRRDRHVVALAGLMLVSRAAGEQFRMGLPMQSPAVVTGLAVLFSFSR